MELHIPDELQEHPDGERLLQKMIDKLPSYLQLDQPGARLELMQTEGGNDHVRLCPGTIDHDHVRRQG